MIQFKIVLDLYAHFLAVQFPYLFINISAHPSKRLLHQLRRGGVDEVHLCASIMIQILIRIRICIYCMR